MDQNETITLRIRLIRISSPGSPATVAIDFDQSDENGWSLGGSLEIVVPESDSVEGMKKAAAAKAQDFFQRAATAEVLMDVASSVPHLQAARLRSEGE